MERHNPEITQKVMPRALNRANFAKLLHQARGRESQSSLAARCDISDKTISQLESGKSASARPGTIAALAIATEQDPHTWLALLGLTLPEKEIENLRAEVARRKQAKAGELKPAAEIEAALLTEIEERTSKFESPEELRKYSDMGDQELRTRIQYLESRVEHISSQLNQIIGNLFRRRKT